MQGRADNSGGMSVSTSRGTQPAGARRRDADAYYLELADGGEAGGSSFHDIFNLEFNEALIEDFACAISRSILLQGRMYITQDHVCFHSSLFGHRTVALLHFEQIASLRKVTHALINPGIEICAGDGEVYSFASFFFRCVRRPRAAVHDGVSCIACRRVEFARSAPPACAPILGFFRRHAFAPHASAPLPLCLPSSAPAPARASPHLPPAAARGHL